MPEPTWPRRGEIWWAELGSDPDGKGPRPVVVVSLDARNRHPRARTVLAVPLTTSILSIPPTHLPLRPGETGLPAESAAMAEAVTTLRKGDLRSRAGTRSLSDRQICALAEKVRLAMGCGL